MTYTKDADYTHKLTVCLFSLTARRRHLMDTSGSSLVQNNLSIHHGSQSSEDTTRGDKHNHDNLDDDDSVDGEEDDDDCISLNQFLNESNRSPKSRVKTAFIFSFSFNHSNRNKYINVKHSV